MSADKVTTFLVSFCEVSGDPGCLGWPSFHDGPCKMVECECHSCTECNADDVYGELLHDTTCSLYVQKEVPL